mmetsp:Transcript_24799/g.78388  ORF Transcript_24799/g.78388 Transcript_24799/m.78388 type:complete len:516 (+) Transcript_24799:1115-2662(+)
MPRDHRVRHVRDPPVLLRVQVHVAEVVVGSEAPRVLHHVVVAGAILVRELPEARDDHSVPARVGLEVAAAVGGVEEPPGVREVAAPLEALGGVVQVHEALGQLHAHGDGPHVTEHLLHQREVAGLQFDDPAALGGLRGRGGEIVLAGGGAGGGGRAEGGVRALRGRLLAVGVARLRGGAAPGGRELLGDLGQRAARARGDRLRAAGGRPPREVALLAPREARVDVARGEGDERAGVVRQAHRVRGGGGEGEGVAGPAGALVAWLLAARPLAVLEAEVVLRVELRGGGVLAVEGVRGEEPVRGGGGAAVATVEAAVRVVAPAVALAVPDVRGGAEAGVALAPEARGLRRQSYGQLAQAVPPLLLAAVAAGAAAALAPVPALPRGVGDDARRLEALAHARRVARGECVRGRGRRRLHRRRGLFRLRRHGVDALDGAPGEVVLPLRLGDVKGVRSSFLVDSPGIVLAVVRGGGGVQHPRSDAIARHALGGAVHGEPHEILVVAAVYGLAVGAVPCRTP